MAFLVGKVELQVYTDSAQTANPRELVPNIQKDFTSTAITGVMELTLTLASGASQVVNLNGLTSVDGLYLYSSATDVGVAINGLAEITFRSQKPSIANIGLTSLTVTNHSVTTDTVVSLVLFQE